MKSLRLAVLILLPVLCLAACAHRASNSQSDEDAVRGMTQTGKNM